MFSACPPETDTEIHLIQDSGHPQCCWTSRYPWFSCINTMQHLHTNESCKTFLSGSKFCSSPTNDTARLCCRLTKRFRRMVGFACVFSVALNRSDLKQDTRISVCETCSTSGVSKLRPVGQIWPAKPFHPAAKTIMKKFTKHLLFW